MKQILFFDLEINPETEQILDIGAIDAENRKFHSRSKLKFLEFAESYDTIGGHNIFGCDLKYLDENRIKEKSCVDTLWLSPLLFPSRPYHHLVKDDKLLTDSLSNPLNDSMKSRELFYDEIEQFHSLKKEQKDIYYSLLYREKEFSGFFQYLEYSAQIDVESAIASFFSGKICSNKNLTKLVQNLPVELSYSLALILAEEEHSVIPSWVRCRYPKIDRVMQYLRNISCLSYSTKKTGFLKKLFHPEHPQKECEYLDMIHFGPMMGKPCRKGLLWRL